MIITGPTGTWLYLSAFPQNFTLLVFTIDHQAPFHKTIAFLSLLLQGKYLTFKK